MSILGNLIRSPKHPYFTSQFLLIFTFQCKLQFWLNNFNFQFLLEPISSEAVMQTTIPV